METSAQQREEREKGKLVKRDSAPQSPRWKSRNHPAISGDELDWQKAASPRAGTRLWVRQFGKWVLGQGRMLKEEEEDDDQGPI